MSVYETTVNNFIHLLKTQPSLFSEPDKFKLRQLIDSQSDEIKALSNAIANWCLHHPQLDDAMAELEEEESITRFPGNTKANTNIPQYKLDKKTLLNAIQQSSSSTNKVEKDVGNN